MNDVPRTSATSSPSWFVSSIFTVNVSPLSFCSIDSMHRLIVSVSPGRIGLVEDVLFLAVHETHQIGLELGVHSRLP